MTKKTDEPGMHRYESLALGNKTTQEFFFLSYMSDYFRLLAFLAF